MPEEFNFLDPGRLVDGEIELILVQKDPWNEEKQYVPTYKFDIFNNTTREKMGHVHLRIGANENIFYGENIGYGIDEKYRGHHYAARATKLLLNLAKKHKMKELYITCNVDNLASARTAELAGFEFVEIVEVPPHNEMYARNEFQKRRYKIKL